MYYQIPSVPMIRNKSCSCNMYFFIDGSAITPTECANLSPKDRDIARPGEDRSGSQTLSGPTLNPLKSLKCSTDPPLSIILAFSKGLSTT